MLAFQQVPELPRPIWPSTEVPQQLHFDFQAPSTVELHRHRARAQQLGANVLLDRSTDDEEPLFVLADPAGHPFCLLVSES